MILYYYFLCKPLKFKNTNKCINNENNHYNKLKQGLYSQ